MAHTLRERPKRVASPYIVILALAALAPLAAMRLLHAMDVPLGRPDARAATTSPATDAPGGPQATRTLVYPYSAIPMFRLRSVLLGLPIAGGAAAAVLLAASAAPKRRRWGLGLGLAMIAGSAYWCHVAPPHYRSQHVFTLQSPAHDGAFVWESRLVDSIPEYLSGFARRARTSEEEMWGTRVISNPPLATVLATLVRRSLRTWPGLRDFCVRYITGDFGDLPPSAVENLMTSVVYAWVLTGLWAASGVTCYLLGRLFLSTPAALTFAYCCVISPMTLLFAPGKDPAQLLSISAAMYLWLAACRGQKIWLAVLSGVAAVATAMIGLIHIWIGLIALGATAMHAVRVTRQARGFVLRCVVPGVVGVVATLAVCQLALQWDIIAVILAVSQSQAEVTRGPTAMPLVWQALGIPLFLLFAGPALWSMALWQAVGRRNDANARLGLYLQVGSIVVMVATVGFTNLETPRLWIAFVPLLLLGAALRLPAFSTGRGFNARLLAALVAVQLASSALQWSFMDMRETEMRIGEGRFFR
ncbi:MAG: hypothetical protein IID33_01585 [Planctomycetes bacterium]|nr:hypothetical protein [Planctomycetota bacterium]